LQCRHLVVVELDERVLQVLRLGDESIGVGVETEKEILGLLGEDAVA
jgi:hypothetical protein